MVRRPAWSFRPPEALCGGISKVNFQETLSSFGDKCPQNGSKNEQRALRTSMGCPHIGPFVDPPLGRALRGEPTNLDLTPQNLDPEPGTRNPEPKAPNPEP